MHIKAKAGTERLLGDVDHAHFPLCHFYTSELDCDI